MNEQFPNPQNNNDVEVMEAMTPEELTSELATKFGINDAFDLDSLGDLAKKILTVEETGKKSRAGIKLSNPKITTAMKNFLQSLEGVSYLKENFSVKIPTPEGSNIPDVRMAFGALDFNLEKALI